jgi:hypothetical protein
VPLTQERDEILNTHEIEIPDHDWCHTARGITLSTQEEVTWSCLKPAELSVPI